MLFTTNVEDKHTFRLIIPFYLRDEINGIVLVDSLEDLTPHKTLVEGLVRIYSNHLYLLDESEHDKLTGLYNRRAFEKKLHRLLALQRTKKIETDSLTERNQRQETHDHTEAWLAIVDIDHFKQVNDNWGHLIGDEVLLNVSRVMRESFRKSDLLFRFGGEEFLILLEPTPEKMASMVFNRFRQAIEKNSFPKIENLTISAGFTRITKNDFPTEIIERADKALYYAKDNGRNMVCHYETLIKDGKIKQRVDFDPIEVF